jgi:hypothetical protein
LEVAGRYSVEVTADGMEPSMTVYWVRVAPGRAAKQNPGPALGGCQVSSDRWRETSIFE